MKTTSAWSLWEVKIFRVKHLGQCGIIPCCLRFLCIWYSLCWNKTDARFGERERERESEISIKSGIQLGFEPRLFRILVSYQWATAAYKNNCKIAQSVIAQYIRTSQALVVFWQCCIVLHRVQYIYIYPTVVMQNQYNTNVSYTHGVHLRHTVCSGMWYLHNV